MVAARMVDVTGKPSVYREATARGFIRLKPETVRLIREGGVAKGDPLSIAKLAGIMAAKQTHSLIPLAHPLPLTNVEVEAVVKDDGVEVEATTRVAYKTGCEVDALVAVAAALLSIFDTVKQYEKDEEGQYPVATIEGLRVLRKEKAGPAGAPAFEKHRAAAPRELSFALITCSTSRYKSMLAGKVAEDEAGSVIADMLRQSGHRLVSRELVPDDEAKISEAAKRALERDEVHALVVCGGTGITASDVTIEAVRPLLDKELPGFGELFRRLSYERVGSPAMLTRALAGVARGKAVFCLPGSPQAVEIAMRELVLTGGPHIVAHARGLA